jgi:NDP-sugar pyrophosphorylase family protein
MIKCVFILAGGLGTRIQPLFPDTCKPMIPVHGKPFLEWQIQMLIDQGFDQFVLCVGYRVEQVIDHFADGQRWGIQIDYSIESKPLGTAGALKHAARFFQDTSLVLNGDTYLATDFQKLIRQHQAVLRYNHLVGSLGLVTVPDTSRYGEVAIDGDQRVVEFREKVDRSSGGLISAGAYVLEPGVLNLIPIAQSVSIEKEVFPNLAATKQLCGFEVTGQFVDMGTPEGYRTLESLLA